MRLFVIIVVFILFLLLLSCSNSTESSDPIVITADLTHISSLGETDGAINVTCSGGKPPYSFAWSIGGNTEDLAGIGAGLYTVWVTDSDNNNAQESFTLTQPDTGTVTDIDGNVYKTVKIGTQIWMAENLRVKHDPQGNPLTDYISPNNDSTNISLFGLLYHPHTVMNADFHNRVPGAQGIAPDGWHIPTSEEFNVLINFLGGETVAGGKMKDAGTEHWNPPNNGATNSSRFTALPAGRNSSPSFFGEETFFWTSDALLNCFRLSTISSYCLKDETTGTDYWLSVRCIKN